MVEYQIKIPIPTVLKKKSKAIYSLNTHNNTHYRTYSAIKNKYKAIYLKALQEQDRVCLDAFTVKYEVWTRNKRKIDLDNIIFVKKFLQDTMVENGYAIEDNCTVLSKNTEVFGGVDTDAEYSYVIATIRGEVNDK